MQRRSKKPAFSSAMGVILSFTLFSSSSPLFAQATSVIGNLPGQPSGSPSGTVSGAFPSASSSIQPFKPAPRRSFAPLKMTDNPSYGANPSFNPSSVESGEIVYYGPHGSGSVLVDKTIVYGDDVSKPLVQKYGQPPYTTSIGNLIANACAQLSPEIKQAGDCINIEVPTLQGNWRNNWSNQMGIALGPQSTDSVVVFYPQSFDLIHCATATYNTNTVGNDPDLPPPAPLNSNPLQATKDFAVAAEADPDHNTLMSFAGRVICYHNRPCPYQPGLQKKAKEAKLAPSQPGLIGQQGSPSMVQFCAPPDKSEPIGLPNQP